MAKKETQELKQMIHQPVFHCLAQFEYLSGKVLLDALHSQIDQKTKVALSDFQTEVCKKVRESLYASMGFDEDGE